MQKFSSLVQIITSTIYVKGFAYILYKFRNIFKNADSIYTIPGKIKLNLNLDDYFENAILWGFYEYSVKIIVNSYVNNGGIFIDVGANLGFFSSHAAKSIGPSGSVYAFEPNPHLADRIAQNIALNNFSNVQIISKAISDTAGEAKFYVGKQHALSSLRDSYLSELETVIDVEVSTLDAEVHAHRISPANISLIKIDVEGHEFNVFKGMQELLKYKPKIIFENNPLALAENGYSLIDIWEAFLKKHNYQMFYLNSKKNHTFLSFYQLDRVQLNSENLSKYKDLPGDILCI
jgi:FkbM family methyltransferase